LFLLHPYRDSLFFQKDGESQEELLFNWKEMPRGLNNLHLLITKQLEMKSIDSLIDDFFHG